MSSFRPVSSGTQASLTLIPGGLEETGLGSAALSSEENTCPAGLLQTLGERFRSEILQEAASMRLAARVPIEGESPNDACHLEAVAQILIESVYHLSSKV